MWTFLSESTAALAANAFKLVFGIGAAAALFGGGFVLGDNHATSIALKSAASDAAARVAAAREADQALLATYMNQLNRQKSRGDALAASLVQTQTKLAAATDAARKALADAVSQNPACDLDPAAIGVLRTARQ
jgi:hypothetical protein